MLPQIDNNSEGIDQFLTAMKEGMDCKQLHIYVQISNVHLKISSLINTAEVFTLYSYHSIDWEPIRCCLTSNPVPYQLNLDSLLWLKVVQ